MRDISRIHRVLAAAVLAVGCSDSPTEPSSLGRTTGTPEPVLHLVVAPALATLHAGESLRLTATAANQDRSVVREISVTWLSSDSEIATVSATGIVRGIRPGQAEITARWGTSRALAKLTVLKENPRPVACVSLITKDEC